MKLSKLYILPGTYQLSQLDQAFKAELSVFACDLFHANLFLI